MTVVCRRLLLLLLLLLLVLHQFSRLIGAFTSMFFVVWLAGQGNHHSNIDPSERSTHAWAHCTCARRIRRIYAPGDSRGTAG
uniref:Putative secreted protein n=1 Tax=Anopheles darlingi TaxID=43151 RepID=A0A2M4D495_ANODA